MVFPTRMWLNLISLTMSMYGIIPILQLQVYKVLRKTVHSYYVKNTSVTKNCTKIPVIDHSKAKGDHSYADVVKFGDKHQNKHVGDHSYACTVEESGALHNKNNEKSIIPNPQIEQGDKQDCVIEDGVFHDNLSKNSMALVLADIKNMPSKLTYVD